MHSTLLKILRCPFCGGSLQFDGPHRGDNAILACACCTYPVVDGIPFMQTGLIAEAALAAMKKNRVSEARAVLLGRPIRKLPAKFRDALQIFAPDAEGDYLFHRFSNPTFLRTRSLLRAIGVMGNVLDLCGGAGHLSRFLSDLPRKRDVFLADLSFWKIWLAKKYVAPTCHPVCCDANNPLPFAHGAFSLSVCSDAFHYIWSKAQAARELIRTRQPRGTIVLAHLHNALIWNYSPGMPLSPDGYRGLFEREAARLFPESSIPLDLPGENIVDLFRRKKDLAKETAIALIASSANEIFRRHVLRSTTKPRRSLRLNPLYRSTNNGVVELHFPSADYEAEYSDCLRHLPREIELNGDRDALQRRGVLLDLPKNYC